ncbi:hypothetical protein TcCL_ESM00962 [Trypanosoma cruzi]|nr:hypothetical protein TcCL_ESM00962 [Trypanosoma cruzi]
MDEGPLLRVALWAIACSVCVVCWLRGCGRVPFSVGLNWRRRRWVTSSSCPLVVDCWQCLPSFCVEGRILSPADWQHCDGVFVCEGWCGVAGQGVALGDAFPTCLLFLLCVLCCFLPFPLSPFSPVFLRGVAACSRAMLIVSAS